MTNGTDITGLVVRSVMEHLSEIHEEQAKGKTFWQRFFGDDVAIALQHIAHRPDVCDEIADAINASVEMLNGMRAPVASGEFSERRGQA